MDIHVQVDGALSVTKSHTIAHRVKECLIGSDLRIKDVVVHIEPKEGKPATDPAADCDVVEDDNWVRADGKTEKERSA